MSELPDSYDDWRTMSDEDLLDELEDEYDDPDYADEDYGPRYARVSH